MSENRPDDAMVEISDIDDDPNPSSEPAVVVIQYRDRGVPWMLIPPLVALSAVIAVAGFYAVNARLQDRQLKLAAIDSSRVGQPVAGGEQTATVLSPLDVPDPVVVENPPSLPTSPEPPKPATEVAPKVAGPAISEEIPVMTPEPLAEPAPRVNALGFDPATINKPADPASAESTAPLDRSLAAAGQTAPGADPAANPVQPDQPEVVAEGSLPPDPRKAQIDRKRREIKARKELEANRFEFHADLAAITKRFGQKSAPAIRELCKAYSQEIPQAAINQAHKELGMTGRHVGAGTTERITLLRSLGFPEPSVLDDLYDIESRHISERSRNAPTPDELYIRSALLLLNHPPGRSNLKARAVAAPRANPSARTPVVAPNPTAIDPSL